MSWTIARNVRRSFVGMSGLTLLAAGCTGGDAQRSAYTPTYTRAECPAEIRTSTTRATTCGYLTVPENRLNPSGRKVRLFVFRMEPDIPTTAVPVVYVGNDLGSSLDYPATSLMADHLDGPEVIGLESRGTGHSVPNLSCPEVEALSPQALTSPIDDPGLRQAFAEAVKACHDRLVGQRINLSSYGVADAAADIVDLVKTLGLKRWEMISKGSTSRLAFQVIRTRPAGLKGVVLYNPEFPGTDPFVQAFRSTRGSIDHLSALCDADARCSRWFPNIARSVDEAIRRYDRHPVEVRVPGARVLLDGARLLRDLRNLLADVHPDIDRYLHLPATIDALAHAKDPASSLSAIVAPEITAPTFCTGFLPTCSTVLNQGAYYSMLCQDIVPFARLSSLAPLAGGDTAWTDDYVHGPYGDVCSAWRIAPADRSITASVASDVPVLVYSGELDPFLTTQVVREGIKGLRNAIILTGAAQSHWVNLGQPPPCASDNSRNEFLADPTSTPAAGCQEHFQPTFASSPL